MQSGERVLDMAAGSGALTLAAAKLGARVEATDFSPLMIRRLQARLRRRGLINVGLSLMDGQTLALADDLFDAAFSVFGLIFFPDKARGFRELHRVLRPRGRAAVVSWSSPDRVRIVSVFWDAMKVALPDLDSSTEPPAVFSLSDPRRLAQEMRGAGFREVRTHTVTHLAIVESPEFLWEKIVPASPVFAALLAPVAEERWAAVGRTLVEMLRGEFGNGPVKYETEAHVGLGVK